MTTTVQPSRDIAHQDSIVIRALSSITSQQAESIAQAIQAEYRAWGVQTGDDYDGYLSIIVEPIIHSDKQKSFFVAGTAQHLKLFEVCDDNMMSVATFNDVEELSARLLDLIGQQ